MPARSWDWCWAQFSRGAALQFGFGTKSGLLQQRGGGTLLLAGMHADGLRTLECDGLLAAIGAKNIFWSADQAIVAAKPRAASAPRNPNRPMEYLSD
ncbi:MAG: hypothetical protein O3B16_04175 [Chloroflexi bacterium]|nr:hypothetical protein [Chloroflexota bacterium]